MISLTGVAEIHENIYWDHASVLAWIVSLSANKNATSLNSQIDTITFPKTLRQFIIRYYFAMLFQMLDCLYFSL